MQRVSYSVMFFRMSQEVFLNKLVALFLHNKHKIQRDITETGILRNHTQAQTGL